MSLTSALKDLFHKRSRNIVSVTVIVKIGQFYDYINWYIVALPLKRYRKNLPYILGGSAICTLTEVKGIIIGKYLLLKSQNLFSTSFLFLFIIVATYILQFTLIVFLAAVTAQKVKFFIKDFCNKCDQIRSFLQIGSHLLKKSLMENFISFTCSESLWNKENYVYYSATFFLLFLF